MAAKCGPDIIYLDAEGGTGAGPHTAAEETGIPLMAAIPRRRALEDVGSRTRSTLSSQAVSATGVGAAGQRLRRRRRRHRPLGPHGAQLQQGDPGVTDYEGTIGARRPVLPLPHGSLPGRDHDPGPGAPQAAARRGGREPRLQLPPHAHARGADARARVREDERALARARGLCALTTEAAAMARVPLAGTDYIPGVSEERALHRIETLLDRYLANLVDELPACTRRPRPAARAPTPSRSADERRDFDRRETLHLQDASTRARAPASPRRSSRSTRSI